MAKFSKKILISLIIIFMTVSILLSFNSAVFAGTNATNSGSFPSSTNSLTAGAGNVQNGLTNPQGKAIKIVNTIFRVVQIFSIFYIIAKFTIVGIKYLTASAVGRGELKKSGEIWRTLILAIIVFGAVGFFNIIWDAFYK